MNKKLLSAKDKAFEKERIKFKQQIRELEHEIDRRDKCIKDLEHAADEMSVEQEKKLRITEIEATLENHLWDSKIEELALDIELQLLKGYENAYVEIDTGETLEIIFDKNIEQFSMLIHDAEGNPMQPYYNADTIEELLETVCKY